MKHRKTNRAKKVDHGCRNHGLCDWCRGNRLHQARREGTRADAQLNEHQRR